MPSQEDINHQRSMLSTHRRNLAQYLKQAALLGAAFVPPAVSNGIVDTRVEIARIKAILRSWGSPVEDYPDDEEPPQSPIVAVQPAAARRTPPNIIWTTLGIIGVLLIAGLLVWQIQRPRMVTVQPTSPAAATVIAAPAASIAAPVFTLRYAFAVDTVEQVELMPDPVMAATIPVSGFLRLTQIEFGVFEREDEPAWNLRLVLTNTSSEPMVLDINQRFFALVDDQGRAAELAYFCCDSQTGEVLGAGKHREMQLMFRSVDGWYGKATSAGAIYLEIRGLLPVVRATWRFPTLATGS